MKLYCFICFATLLFCCACLTSYKHIPDNNKDGKYSFETYINDQPVDMFFLSVFIRWPYAVEPLEKIQLFEKNLSTGENKQFTRKDKGYSTFNGYNVINLASQRAVTFDSLRVTPKIIASGSLKDFTPNISYNKELPEVTGHFDDFFVSGDTTIANIKYMVLRDTIKRQFNGYTIEKIVFLLDKRYKNLPITFSKLLGEKFNGWVCYYQTIMKAKNGNVFDGKSKINYIPVISKSEDSILTRYITLAKDSLR